ncbi:MAG: hypothetical protein CSB46_07865 [Micrococcales bacterium]|nr:MAG: hypothetical protein CSB46_07865 [Micrococcales bacterium]
MAGLPFPGAGDPPIGSRPLLLFAGVGAATTTHWRRAGAAVAAASKDAETVFVTSLVPDDTAGPAAEAVPAEQTAHAFTEGLVLGSWKQPKPGSSAEGVPEREPTTYLLAGLAADLVDDAARRAESTLLARVLSTTPSNIKTPAWMARQATALAKGVEHLSVQVRDHKALRQEGFGGHLAVSAGSANPPRLVTLTWDPPQAREHVVLIGKGITFDTGGLSIKPREAMVPMKTDMTGSAVVLSTVLAAARSRLPVRLTGILALAENAVGASSYRPGDVVRVWGGRTVEVANTDAEGRMVLADALAWSAATLDPDAVLDVATLTGAATMGLGRGHGCSATTTRWRRS